MDQVIKDQLDQILDEGEGAYRDVIVHFKSERDASLSDLLGGAVETERARATIVDPHNILPPAVQAFDGLSSRAGRLSRSQAASLSANLALLVPYGAPINSGKATSDFLEGDEFQKAFEGVKSRLKRKARLAEPLPLPNIDSVRFLVNREDLDKVIADKADLINGVYENVHVEAPRVMEVEKPRALSGKTHNRVTYNCVTWGLEQTRALAAWSAFNTKGRDKDGKPIRVAVLDTGIDPLHPDISPRLVDFVEIDASGKKIRNGVKQARDSGKHGTHVAGTIVGGNASGGWIGMAPDAELISALVLNGKKGGSLAQIIKGIDWAVSEGAHVINLSLGSPTLDSTVGTPYQRAIVDALVRGTLVVVSIGNAGHQTTGTPGNDYFSLAVAAHDANLRCAGFSGGRTHRLTHSNYIDPAHLPLIYTKPDLSAPGVQVTSSIPGKKWATMSGTSMAAPHVSGAAALLFAATSLLNRAPRDRAFVARDLLLGGVTEQGEAGQDQRFGYGSLNVLKSIDEAIARGF